MQLRSDNIKRSRSISPLKQQIQFSQNENLMVDGYVSPLKNISTESRPLSASSNSTFTIYSDETYYRASHIQQISSQSKKVSNNPQVSEQNKENIEITEKRKQLVLQKSDLAISRLPLRDLDTKLYPGFIQMSTNDSILQPRYQLTEVYKPEVMKYKSLPSFVTPPRKRVINLKYQFKSKNLITKLRKSQSFDQRINKPFVTKTRNPKFDIFKDDVISL